MTYYIAEKYWFYVNDTLFELTEEQAEQLTEAGMDVVAKEEEIDYPDPDELLEELLPFDEGEYLTCEPDDVMYFHRNGG